MDNAYFCLTKNTFLIVKAELTHNIMAMSNCPVSEHNTSELQITKSNVSSTQGHAKFMFRLETVTICF